MPCDREKFLNRIMVKLGSGTVNFSEKFSMVKESASSPAPSLAAGVMLPLYFSQKDSSSTDRGSDVFFRLIKRSRAVSQAGDLACPGGILQENLDPLLRIFIISISSLVPLLRNRAGRLTQERGGREYRTITLFLANALREAWEEIRINPFHVNFLGALPPYSLTRQSRTIFPLVCHVDKQTPVAMNHEVEYVLDMPLAAFFDTDNYACLYTEVENGADIPGKPREVLPCLIYRDEKRGENILWGATFFIIMSFLEIVCDFKLPDWQDRRVVRKMLDRGYITGMRQ